MNRAAIVLTGALIGFAIKGYSQEWKATGELFLNSSGFPKSYQLGDGTSHIKPRIHPGVGFRLSAVTRLNVFVDLAIRYADIGLTDTYNYRGVDPNTNQPYTVNREESFSFRKLSFGAGLGYRIPFRNNAIYVSGGYRLIRYISGNYQYTYSSRNGIGGPIDYQKQFDPFGTSNLDIPAKRSGHDIYVDVGIRLKKHLSISLQYSFPTDIIFIENANSHNGDQYHSYLNNDASISIGWTL